MNKCWLELERHDHPDCSWLKSSAVKRSIGSTTGFHNHSESAY